MKSHFSEGFLGLVLVAMLALGPARIAAQDASACMRGAGTPQSHVLVSSCQRVWIDSIASQMTATATRARAALSMTGGRAAVDALRADYERSPERQRLTALILAMGTTGSPEDIAFLLGQVRGPFVGLGFWPGTTHAATQLGLLRAASTRDSLQALLRQNGERGFSGRAVLWAIAAFGRPQCADSARGEITRDLVRIVVACEPQALWPTARYSDSTASGVWSHAGGSWQLTPRTAVDTVGAPRLFTSVTVHPGERYAEVRLRTFCGRLCGEVWTYRLMLQEGRWRVTSAVLIAVA